MKHEDLTEEQQIHFLYISDRYPEFPKGATHLDTDDNSLSSFMLLGSSGYLYWMGSGWQTLVDMDCDALYEIPDEKSSPSVETRRQIFLADAIERLCEYTESSVREVLEALTGTVISEEDAGFCRAYFEDVDNDIK